MFLDSSYNKKQTFHTSYSSEKSVKRDIVDSSERDRKNLQFVEIRRENGRDK
jgi:hypothetical protein